MKNTLLELTPINYSPSAIKQLHFKYKPQQTCIRLHWHERMELIRIHRGKLVVEYGTASAEVFSGELIILPPKTLHRGYTTDDMVEYDVLMFDVRSFYNETENCKALLPAIFDGRAVFKNIISDSKTIACFDYICKNDKDSLEITSNIYRLFYLLYENSLLELRNKPKNASVKKIIDYLEENFNEEINIDSLSKQFGYTSAHLCRKFKQSTGLTPMVYLKIYRLEWARKNIKSSDLAVSEIAAACGYPDANYFTRCFKAHFGITPTKCRK